MNEKTVDWSVYSCAQNLSAILNDPNRGKQKDFFTKTWGENFVDNAPIPPSPFVDDIPNAYFAPYCRKLLKRYRRLQERKSSTSISQTQDPHLPFFPQLASRDSSSRIIKPDTSPIPRIYFSPNFALANSETFREVFNVDSKALPSRLIQDKLSHYLDLVEVGLAQQISKKSSAFFSAVSTQDKVAEKVTQALSYVQLIKKELKDVREDHVTTPLRIVSFAEKRHHLNILLQKLQLMFTVHQAQRAIQSLLGNSDYVGALDLISTTQEVLRQELQGLVSFRHLDSQLVEIRNAIEKMLRADLERNLSADLNRPIEQMTSLLDQDRLVSIIMGYLRIGKVAPVVTVLAKEIGTAMTATGKQTLIEAVSESDSKSDTLVGSNSVQMAIPHLTTELWIRMISQLGQRLVQLLEHIKVVILLFQKIANSAVGNTSENFDAFINETEEPLISSETFTTFLSELSNQLEKTTATADEKFTSIFRYRKTWLHRQEFIATLEAVRDFVASLEDFANSLNDEAAQKVIRYTAMAEMKTQTMEYFRIFHQKETEIVNLALDREKWRVPAEEKVKVYCPTVNMEQLIHFVARAYSQSHFDMNSNNNEDKQTTSKSELARKESSNSLDSKSQNQIANPNNMKVSEVRNIENGDGSSSEVKTAEIFYILLRVIAEYSHLVSITNSAEIVLGCVDLLRNANARVAHLVLGAGAVELKLVKSITVASLAVVVRGLCLLSTALPEAKEKFKDSLPSKNHHLLKHVDAVTQEICRHAEDVENKMVSIVAEVIEAELQNWEARPPVPSPAINNVAKNIGKFRDAIGSVLTEKQISNLFIRVDKAFRTKLKERIASIGIVKDGGPRHGVVTSEMMHYAENLRKLNVLPANVISNAGLTHELWSAVKS